MSEVKFVSEVKFMSEVTKRGRGISKTGDASQREKELSTLQMKKYIKTNLPKITDKNDILDIAKTLINNGLKDDIKIKPTGGMINLNIVEEKDPSVIRQIYSQVQYKLSK